MSACSVMVKCALFENLKGRVAIPCMLQDEGFGCTSDLEAARATLAAAQQQDLDSLRRAHQSRMDFIYGNQVRRQRAKNSVIYHIVIYHSVIITAFFITALLSSLLLLSQRYLSQRYYHH